MSEIGDHEVQAIIDDSDAQVTDLMDAVPKVLKKALMHDGLVKGLHEVAKKLDAKQVLLCFLAESCSEPAYKSLVQALCKQNGVPLIDVPDSKELGQWVGLCKLDKENKPRKIVGASCVAITDFGEESNALSFLQEHIKTLA